MYTSLFHGTVQYAAAFWTMLSFIIICLSILFLSIRVHLKKNRIARKMTELETVYENLVKSVRFGKATDDEIKTTILPQDYLYFQKYLQATISTIEDIDVSAEKKIAEVSGFMDHLKKRIEKSKKWEKTLAVRTLTYFREKENIPLFQKLMEKEQFIQTVYAAGLGLALCKDTESFLTVGRRIWEASEHNKDALLVILNIYGKDIASSVHDFLREGNVADEVKPVIIDYFSEFQYSEAADTVKNMLQVETSEHIIGCLLSALKHLGNRETLDAALPFLKHEDYIIRSEALNAVAELGGAEYLLHVEECLNDENWWVRREAAKAMAGMGEKGISRLQAVSQEDKEDPKIAARSMLAELEFHRIAEVDY
jgi:uncharacterized protein YoxC